MLIIVLAVGITFLFANLVQYLSLAWTGLVAINDNSKQVNNV